MRHRVSCTRAELALAIAAAAALATGCDRVFSYSAGDSDGPAAGDSGSSNAGDSRGSDAGNSGRSDAARLLPMVVQTQADITQGQTSIRLTLQPTQRGNLLVVASGNFSTAQPIDQMTDDAGNTYVSAGALAGYTDGDITEIWYAANSNPGAETLTISTAERTTRAVWFVEVSGMETAAPLDVVATLDDGLPSAPPMAPRVTPTTDVSFVISSIEVADAVTSVGSPFVLLPVLAGNNAAYTIATARGSYGAEWQVGTMGGYCASTAAFKPAR